MMLKLRFARNARQGPASSMTLPLSTMPPGSSADAGIDSGAHVPRRLRGQALPLLALMMVVLIGFTGLALDASMLVLRTLQQQRAADAAALAGVVRLPDNENSAQDLAREYAGLNGYQDASPGYPLVLAHKVSGYNTRLHVDITARHPLYFMRIFGIQEIQITRSAEAQYALPVHLGCPECYTYGLGNPTPIAHASECTNCILNMTNYNKQQKFWCSIDGPATFIEDGDPYNIRYGIGAGFQQDPCTGTVIRSPLNSDYRGGDPLAAGYSYGMHINTRHGLPLSIYVYDPARYAQGFGIARDTADSGSTCTPPNDPHDYSTIFKIYGDPNQTPEFFGDDVLLWTIPNPFIDTMGASVHNHWFLLRQIDNAWVNQYGDLRLQVVTSDSDPSQEGVGRNEYALALGGARRPQQDESIYGIGDFSTYLNLGQPVGTATPTPGTVEFFLANITREHGGEQMGIRMFDLGDSLCDVTIQVLKQDITTPPCAPLDNCYHAYPFKINWQGSDTYSLDATYNCASGNCSFYMQHQPPPNPDVPLNGHWVTLGVQLPPRDVYFDTWWKIAYTIGNCRPNLGAGNGVTDRVTWELQMIGNPIHLVH